MADVTLLKPASLSTLGRKFFRGKTVPMDDATAAALEDKWPDNFRVRYTRPADVAPAAPAAPTEPSDPAVRRRAILDAIDQLDPENETHFTKNGRPDARALSGLLGWVVKAEERDAAMADAAKETAPVLESVPDAGKGGVRIVAKAAKAESDPTVEGAQGV